jgi:hypothetical protein
MSCRHLEFRNSTNSSRNFRCLCAGSDAAVASIILRSAACAAFGLISRRLGISGHRPLIETGQSEPLDIFASVLGTYEWNPFRDPPERHVGLQPLHDLKRSSGVFNLAC